MSNKKIGELIRSLRKEQGVSLRELAKKVNVSFVNISHIGNLYYCVSVGLLNVKYIK